MVSLYCYCEWWSNVLLQVFNQTIHSISPWLIRDTIPLNQSEALPLSFSVRIFLWSLVSISKSPSFMQGHRSKQRFSARRPGTVKQLPIGSAEIPVEGWVQDGVQSWVKIAQPQDHGVKCVRRVCLFLNSHTGEESEVGEPADDKGPQHGCKRHGGFVLFGNGRSWCHACKWWRGGTNTPHLKRFENQRMQKNKMRWSLNIWISCKCKYETELYFHL